MRERRGSAATTRFGCHHNSFSRAFNCTSGVSFFLSLEFMPPIGIPMQLEAVFMCVLRFVAMRAFETIGWGMGLGGRFPSMLRDRSRGTRRSKFENSRSKHCTRRKLMVTRIHHGPAKGSLRTWAYACFTVGTGCICNTSLQILSSLSLRPSKNTYTHSSWMRLL